MRWKLAKKLLSGKTTCSLESNKYIKRFQAKRYAKLTNRSIEFVENHIWKIWFPYVNHFKYGADDRKPLPPKPILSNGFDGQPEIIAEYFRETIK